MIDQLTNQEIERILLKAGWSYRPGRWYSCRICRCLLAPVEWGFISPNYTIYHTYCVMKSPMARKVIEAGLAAEEG